MAQILMVHFLISASFHLFFKDISLHFGLVECEERKRCVVWKKVCGEEGVERESVRRGGRVWREGECGES